MELRHLRHHAYKAVLMPVSEQYRRRRMQGFSRRMRVTPGMRVLDLGGQPHIWNYVEPKLDITILNLPGVAEPINSTHHDVRYIEGDACAVKRYEDRSFDLVFSNSVIEHVGDESRQHAFAREVRRLGEAYWVQTPAIWFPVEAHSGMPFWWFYPEWVRDKYIEHWKKNLPLWAEMVEGTRVLTVSRMRELFPSAEIYTERLAGVPKSYSAYATCSP